MPGRARHLLGPNLLIQICLKEAEAVKWMQSVKEPDCVLSRLTIAIVRSIINAQTDTQAKRLEWHQALNATIARMEANGATLVDLNETVLGKFHVYRLHEPLQFHGAAGLESVGQDVRLLIATADVMDLVFTDYDDDYMAQLKDTTSVKVLAL